MDIGKLRVEGRCFQCHKKGHFGKDCPKKQEFKDIHLVQTAPEQEKMELKVEENIPAPTLPAFNISSMTSKPVLESTNRYTALLIKGNNNDTPSSTSGDEAKEEAESLPTISPMPGGKSPTIVTPMITAGSARPDGAGQQSESSLPDEAAPREETTARSNNDATRAVPSPVERPRKGAKGKKLSSEAAGRADCPSMTIWVQPVVLLESNASALMYLHLQGICLTDQKNLPSETPSGNANEDAQKEATATGKEAASAQAVNKGHSVTIVEVSDKEDDMVYQQWLAKSKKKEVTSDEPARSSVMTPILMRGWCKPFKVDWMLRMVCEARNDNVMHAALFVWTHKD
ncbi:uncharacterized protein ARMOST_06964 [Armillaria ostoyae]|uniref:CCHC-type domain-containing protein n=1 Tax=Armillaria ostoyae TaxID=47428 RepID=A0A284R4G6_ARMOS|nr:uncharacterized protein ARMOST_06964 [Armillaria ostoyae]